MRIVQLSDIHLSDKNITDLRNFYLEALITDLKSFHDKIPIDIILITGDLVDKGGKSLIDQPGETLKNCYEIFKREILDPIQNALGLKSSQILIIPGNHDIDRNQVDIYVEPYLCGLDKEGINGELQKNKSEFNRVNERIKRFKEFELQYQDGNTDYVYSNNESVSIACENGKKIGFALINDSWRCSSELKTDHHFIGYNQLWNVQKIFKSSGTIINIAVFHHPLLAFSENEREEIETILASQDFDIVFFGHSHKHEAKTLISASGGYFIINGRSAFSHADEKHSQFQPGFNILDIDLTTRRYRLYARKFIKSTGFRFDSDTDSIPGGVNEGYLHSTHHNVELVKAEQSNNNDEELPNSYSANVHRIVSLLIGKSLYPEPYIFVRELIQNSVDACNRVRERHSHKKPNIVINVNTKENYLEVCDEGDGMTKNIIKNHFSVIGRSISQEFSDSTGHFDLISKFGIGFMSTFIVAEKVVVDTKNDEDEQVIFEINDVFKRFNYLEPSLGNKRIAAGTTIRVYMKFGYSPRLALEKALEYLRHIEGLKINLDSVNIEVPNSWNTESSSYKYEHESNRYSLKLGLGITPITFIASNSGFLIGTNLTNIIPFKFPMIIGGEVNFLPKGIDFDMSRTAIMPTRKAETFRLEISVSLRKLFREALESGNQAMVSAVVPYLHYYLQYYDTNNAQMQASYTDFYSKSELISLCSDYTVFPFQGQQESLKEIISSMKKNNLHYIFYVNSSVISDYYLVLSQYLESQGFLIFTNRGVNVSFRDYPQNGSYLGVMQQIAAAHNMRVLDVSQAPADILKDMKMDFSLLPEKLSDMLGKIAGEYSVTIEVGKFGKLPKSSVRNGDQIFLNHEHETFKSLLKKNHWPDEQFKTYLLGILGLGLVD